MVMPNPKFDAVCQEVYLNILKFLGCVEVRSCHLVFFAL